MNIHLFRWIALLALVLSQVGSSGVTAYARSNGAPTRGTVDDTANRATPRGPSSISVAALTTGMYHT